MVKVEIQALKTGLDVLIDRVIPLGAQGLFVVELIEDSAEKPVERIFRGCVSSSAGAHSAPIFRFQSVKELVSVANTIAPLLAEA
jgi:hypothetical protein